MKRRKARPGTLDCDEPDEESPTPPVPERKIYRKFKPFAVEPSAAIRAESLAKKGPTVLKRQQEILAKHTDLKDDYNVGFYNGLELALSILTQREPNYKERKGGSKS